LGNADFRNVTFEGANFQQAVLQGANFAGANLRAASFVAAKLEGADFSRADLSDANLSRSSMSSANLRSATLHNAKLETADLRGANIGKADFTEALIEDANFSHAIGAPSARNLETTALSAVRYFDRVELNWFDRYCDWEHARIFGRLPLFTASYTAMIAIPIVAYGYALYNDAAQSLQKWATTIGPSAGPSQKGIADFVIANLHTVPLPALSLELLVSTVLLAIASTIYAVWCPSRIKEFSRDQWCDEFGKPLIHYCALSWKYPVRRSVCRWRRTRRLRYLGKSRQRRHLHFSELRMGIGVQPDC
jgi:uncharacterized protein YjbI with pentapeptide repeats